jgi:hypothetical protein
MLVHNILPLKGRLSSMGAVADGACAHCGDIEDVVHFFQRCPPAADLWDGLYVKLLSLVPGFSSDLLMLAFPTCPASVERLEVAHLGVLVAKFGMLGPWSFLRPPSRLDLAVSFKAHFPAFRLLF